MCSLRKHGQSQFRFFPVVVAGLMRCRTDGLEPFLLANSRVIRVRPGEDGKALRTSNRSKVKSVFAPITSWLLRLELRLLMSDVWQSAHTRHVFELIKVRNFYQNTLSKVLFQCRWLVWFSLIFQFWRRWTFFFGILDLGWFRQFWMIESRPITEADYPAKYKSILKHHWILKVSEIKKLFFFSLRINLLQNWPIMYVLS